MFLYRTEECLHASGNPIPYVLSSEAKYLCEPVYSDSPNAFRGGGEDRGSKLGRFRLLEADIRRQLADYSYSLYRNDTGLWDQWMSLPVEEQINSMRLAEGGQK